MFNKILSNNVVATFIKSIVKKCNNSNLFEQNLLKFSADMPLTKMDTNENFSFRSITGDEIDCNNIKTC